MNSHRTSRLSIGVSNALIGSSYYSVEEEPGALLRFLMLDEDAIVHTDLLKKTEKRDFCKNESERK